LRKGRGDEPKRGEDQETSPRERRERAIVPRGATQKRPKAPKKSSGRRGKMAVRGIVIKKRNRKEKGGQNKEIRETAEH